MALPLIIAIIDHIIGSSRSEKVNNLLDVLLVVVENKVLTPTVDCNELGLNLFCVFDNLFVGLAVALTAALAISGLIICSVAGVLEESGRAALVIAEVDGLRCCVARILYVDLVELVLSLVLNVSRVWTRGTVVVSAAVSVVIASSVFVPRRRLVVGVVGVVVDTVCGVVRVVEIELGL